MINILNNMRRSQNAGPPDRATGGVIDPVLDTSKPTGTHRDVDSR